MLGLVLTVFGWWAYRELCLDYAQRKYSGEFTPGMKRDVIENRLLSEGIRFFPESADVDFISVGDEVRFALVCAPREVGLLLEFEARDGTSSRAEVLRSVRRVRQERGCL
jgi:hypothetical protein